MRRQHVKGKLAPIAYSQHTAGTMTNQVPGLLVKGPPATGGRPMGALRGGTWIFSNAKEFFLRSHTKPRIMASSEASQLDVRNRKQPSDEVN